MNLAKYIDHTLLKPNATQQEVIQLCNEAKKYGFFSVCVNPFYVPLVRKELNGSGVRITAVVGFPLGANIKEVKAFEAKKAVEQGANEIDMVLNIAALKNKDYKTVKEDITAVLDAINGKAKLKVIIETCLLTEEEKIKACEIAKESGAHFVKTSTGFSSGGATPNDVALMKKTVGSEMGVKASGGIRDKEKAIQMIKSGANRIGASSSVSIVLDIIDNESDY